MALTQDDLDAIKKALEPEFSKSEERVVAVVSKVVIDGLGLVGDQFELVGQRFDRLDHRIDPLRVESHTWAT